MTEIWFNTKRSAVQIECASDKRVRSLRQIRTISVANPKKFMKTFVLVQIFLPSKWPSVHIEVSFDNRAEFFFRQNSVLACLKSQSQKKRNVFRKNQFLLETLVCTNRRQFEKVFSKLLLQKSKHLLLGFLKGVKKVNC